MKNQMSLVIAALLLASCGGGGSGGDDANPPAPPAPPPPPADTTAPQTIIDVAPAAVVYTNSVTLTFSADEGGVTFEGSLDDAAFAAVTSPVTLSSLADGDHAWRVRARDAAGNTDATPAVAQWTVRAGPPDTTLDISPDAATAASTARFAFSSNKPNSTFEASVDGGAFAAAQSPLDLTGLAVGTHHFSVRAIDEMGQVDASPATFTWVVDVTAPTASIQFPTPLSYTDAATITVRGTASDAHGVDTVSVNGVAATSLDGFENWRANVPLSAVTTTLTVSVTDAAGNTTAHADTATVINRGPSLIYLVDLAFDPNGNQVIALDNRANAIHGYRATDGVGRLISAGPSPGAMRGQSAPTALVVDALNNRALFVDYIIDSLVAADLATGVRTIVSPTAGQGSATTLAVANDLAYDPVNDRAFASNVICACIIGMDLATGARSIVASASVGTGAYPASANGLVYDDFTTPGAPRLLTVNFGMPGSNAIVAIDVATGNRSILSSQALAIGTGPAMHGGMGLAIDPQRDRLLIADNSVPGVIAVDLASGNRSIVMGQHDGSGPAFYPGTSIAYDAAANRLYTGQVMPDDILAIDLDSLERTAFIHSHVGTGPEPNLVDAIVLEQPGGVPASLVYSEQQPGGLYRLDLKTGARSVVADASTGTGPALAGVEDFVLDTRPSAGAHKALALVGTPGYLLLSVDLVTGDRTPIADLGAAPAVIEPRHLRLDAPNNRVLFIDGDRDGDGDALYAVDLDSGVRTVISSASVGGGYAVGYFSDFVLEPAVNPTRALVSDETAQGFVAVDLGTGHRTLFADMFSAGFQIQTNRPGPIYLDTPRSRLIGINRGSPGNLYSLDLNTTVQRLLSGPALGSSETRGVGPSIEAPVGLAVDADRQVVYVTEIASGSLIAIDLVSGDRVIIAD